MTLQRVLIVEDHADNADSLAMVLASDARVVAVVDTGEQAIVRALAWKPHLIILDLGLPDVPGEHVVATLRAGGSTAHILVLSGYHDREKAARAAGCDTFIVKPDVEQVLSVAEAVARKAAG